jgi:hypothetical protein
VGWGPDALAAGKLLTGAAPDDAATQRAKVEQPKTHPRLIGAAYRGLGLASAGQVTPAAEKSDVVACGPVRMAAIPGAPR